MTFTSFDPSAHRWRDPAAGAQRAAGLGLAPHQAGRCVLCLCRRRRQRRRWPQLHRSRHRAGRRRRGGRPGRLCVERRVDRAAYRRGAAQAACRPDRARLLQPARRRHVHHRRHRHQRQDLKRRMAWVPRCLAAASRRPSSARWAWPCSRRAAKSNTPSPATPRRTQCCWRARWPNRATPAPPRWRSRCRRTRWSRAASPACTSTSRCSPT